MGVGAPREQLQFLISCVNHSVKGKVDWGAVAKELNIVSKHAAARRYDRIVKSISTVGSPSETIESPGSTQNSPVTPVIKNMTTPNSKGNRITKATKMVNMTDKLKHQATKGNRKRTATEMESSDVEDSANNDSESDDPLVSPLVEMLRRKSGGCLQYLKDDMKDYPLRLQRDHVDVDML